MCSRLSEVRSNVVMTTVLKAFKSIRFRFQWDKTLFLYKVTQHAYLKAAPFGGVQDQELFEQVLAVCGHVEGNPVLPAQHALSQLLVVGKDQASQWEAWQIPLWIFTHCTQIQIQTTLLVPRGQFSLGSSDVENAHKTKQHCSLGHMSGWGRGT